MGGDLCHLFSVLKELSYDIISLTQQYMHMRHNRHVLSPAVILISPIVHSNIQGVLNKLVLQ